jgi:hypothetical protein
MYAAQDPKSAKKDIFFLGTMNDSPKQKREAHTKKQIVRLALPVKVADLRTADTNNL